ncbi:MAG: hypothetical protein ACOYX5_11345 [Actinomycetota bacterium]
MSVTRPRGPLPARVYWFRRLLVLAVVLGLVLGIRGLLGGGDEGKDQTPAAMPASAVSTPAESPTAVATADIPRADPQRPRKPKRTKTPLPMPTGPCQDSDVKVVPTLVQRAYAGGDVRLTLKLTTFQSPACNWEVSPDSVAVRLTSGSDRIWSSQECGKAIPTTQVVLRRRPATTVDVTWSGRRSDAQCSRNTLWAEPGYYHVAAAALGSEPESEQFQLFSPAPVTITPTPTPEPGEKKPAKKKRREGDA